MKTKQELKKLLANYDSNLIARYMLKKVADSTKEEIGRAILSTKIKRQVIFNLEKQ